MHGYQENEETKRDKIGSGLEEDCGDCQSHSWDSYPSKLPTPKSLGPIFLPTTATKTKERPGTTGSSSSSSCSKESSVTTSDPTIRFPIVLPTTATKKKKKVAENAYPTRIPSPTGDPVELPFRSSSLSSSLLSTSSEEKEETPSVRNADVQHEESMTTEAKSSTDGHNEIVSKGIGGKSTTTPDKADTTVDAMHNPQWIPAPNNRDSSPLPLNDLESRRIGRTEPGNREGDHVTDTTVVETSTATTNISTIQVESTSIITNNSVEASKLTPTTNLNPSQVPTDDETSCLYSKSAAPEPLDTKVLVDDDSIADPEEESLVSPTIQERLDAFYSAHTTSLGPVQLPIRPVAQHFQQLSDYLNRQVAEQDDDDDDSSTTTIEITMDEKKVSIVDEDTVAPSEEAFEEE
eukprot:CAMPEP_0176010742 /NCGR_PEP_ID=MMETSP0120_2-20121206/4930_1 /TAXON_ID=160619 /ORGANISM="Kryptoperidinium foliaceum, Strain CCMP 1326" /LENGTH=405 /DNA_ID=CAMNT_0017343593 /DNA_START=63 /DNA_END=1278 /DNA_ORIENTATION=-